MTKANQFTSLAQLETYIKNQFANEIWKNQGFKDIVAEEMSDAVKDVVYSAHEPSRYKRRKDDGGLSDVENVDIVSHPTGNGVVIVVENLTKGYDNLKNEFITDMIEEGDESKWNNPDGVWSEPRPFIQETINRLQSDPSKLTKEVKNTLKSIGLDVK